MIVQGYLAGVRIEPLAQTFGVSRERVYQVLREQGVRPRRSRAQPERNCEIWQRYQNGEGCTGLARSYGLSRNRIWAIIDRERDRYALAAFRQRAA